MGDARTVTAANLITDILYELRDPDGTNYNADGAYAELLGYINKCNETIYEILVDENSELVRTGTGTITTVAGTQSYALASNSMGDFWLPAVLGQRDGDDVYGVWVSTYEPMKMCTQEDLWETINAEENSETGHRTIPERFCIIGGYIWFEQSPDDAYTVYLRYFPNFTPLSATTGTIPYNNLFNQEIIEGVKVLAKHRNDIDVQIDSILKDIFHDRAMRLTRKRKKTSASFSPRIR